MSKLTKQTKSTSSINKSISNEQMNKPTSYAWLPWAIFIFAFALYAKTISFDFVLDDDLFIGRNKYVQNGIASFSDLISKGSMYGFNETNIGGYRPFPLIIFALEHSLFGNSPKSFHFFNIFLYTVLCVVVFNFLKNILKDYNLFLPIIITALFIVHPLHTEVVANIKSMEEILCMLFGILSIQLVYKCAMQKTNQFITLFFASVCFLLAVLSKESGFCFLGLIPLVIYFFSDVSFKRIVALMIPFIAVVVIVFFIRMNVLDSQFVSQKITTYENSLMAATNFSNRLATNFTMLLHALYLLFLPIKLSWDYSYNHFPIVSWSNSRAIISLIVHLGLIILAIVGLKRKSIFSFAILFYFIAYFITSNLVIDLGSSFAERFLFTPSLAFCISLPFIISKIFKIDAKKWAGKNVLYANGIVACIVLLFIIQTINRTKDWKNNSALFTSGLSAAPQSARVHSSYAKFYMKKAEESNNKLEKINFADTAIDEFNKAIAIYPNDYDMYYNFGVVYYTIGDTENAIKKYMKSLDLNATYANSLNNIRFICMKMVEESKDKAEQIRYTNIVIDKFNKAIAINPNDEMYYNLGVVYYAIGDTENALKNYTKSLELNATNTNSLSNIGVIYFGKKEYENALNYFLKLIKTKETDSRGWSNAGACYQNMLDTKNALYYYEKALQINPGNAEVLRNIATLYEKTGDITKAQIYRNQIMNK